MAGVTHTKVSAVDDGADATFVRPSDWNAAHTVTWGTPVATGTANSQGASGNVADASHVHLTDIGAGFFGDSSDGAITLRQSSDAPAWATKSGTTFTLTRDVFSTTFDMDDSAGAFLVHTSWFRIYASTSLIIDAEVIVNADGKAGVADAAGGNWPTGALNATVGGAGSVGATNTTATQAAAIVNSASTSATSATPHGGTGGAATGGGTGGGVAGGNASNLLIYGSPRHLGQAFTNVRLGAAAAFFAGGGGGTGGNATGGSTAKGGGGGGGGYLVWIAAKLLTNNGVIRALGGAGGNGTAGNGSGSGGGGGGGGGYIVLVYGAGSTVGTTTVTGGTGGTPTGTGATGGTGVSGIVYALQL